MIRSKDRTAHPHVTAVSLLCRTNVSLDAELPSDADLTLGWKWEVMRDESRPVGGGLDLMSMSQEQFLDPRDKLMRRRSRYMCA